jgi:hypothetical protein
MLTQYNENDEEDNSLKLHHIRSIPYLEECIAWNSDGNFDRVSAAGMLFLLREDRVKRTNSMIANQNNKIKQASQDSFFEKNWNNNKLNNNSMY